jgi:hypothetical protein
VTGSESGSTVPPSAIFEGAAIHPAPPSKSTTFAFSAEKSEILLMFAILSALRKPENLSWKLTHNYRIVRTQKAHFDLASSAFEGKGNRRRGTAKKGYIRIEKPYSGDSRFKEGC